MELAPIILFAYNRPSHLKRTLDSLALNSEIKFSDLIIYCDGPKQQASIEEIEKIGEVRKIAGKFEGAKNLKVIESQENQGLANSISKGVSETLRNRDYVIVLEDDLLLSTRFLEFMNRSLHKYHKHEQIMHVSGYMPKLKGNFSQLSLINLTHSWGWGTWKRAWHYYNEDALALMNEILTRKQMRYFDYDGTFKFFRLLRRTHEGTRDSWAVRWYASVFLNGGLSLNPTVSLVRNIGHDSSGTHSYGTKTFDNQIFEGEIDLDLREVKEDQNVRKALKRFFLEKKLRDGIPYYWHLFKEKIKIA